METIKLYRYFGTHGYETLRDQRLKLSLPSGLNDPFEFHYQIVGEMTREKALEIIEFRKTSDNFFQQFQSRDPGIKTKADLESFIELHKDVMADAIVSVYRSENFDPSFSLSVLDDEYRIASFTSTDFPPDEEILMWSHYSRKHVGIRIEFDMPIRGYDAYILEKVKYSDKRVQLDMTNPDAYAAIMGSLENLLTTKANCWSYEREYRMIVATKKCAIELIDGKAEAFLNFSPEIVSGIDIGINCSDEAALILQVAMEKYKHATIRKAERHNTDFRIIYKPA